VRRRLCCAALRSLPEVRAGNEEIATRALDLVRRATTSHVRLGLANTCGCVTVLSPWIVSQRLSCASRFLQSLEIVLNIGLQSLKHCHDSEFQDEAWARENGCTMRKRESNDMSAPIIDPTTRFVTSKAFSCLVKVTLLKMFRSAGLIRS
jgi:hypothetical protein